MKAMDEIYELYADDLYKYLLKLSGNAEQAEDMVQETFLKAIQQIDSYRGEGSMKAWLLVIAKNIFYSRMRSPWHKLKAEDNEHIADIDFREKLYDRDEARQIHRILHNLSEPYKEVFSLRVFGELPLKEIAEIFGKSESWAKVTFFRAKSQIIEKMNDEK